MKVYTPKNIPFWIICCAFTLGIFGSQYFTKLQNIALFLCCFSLVLLYLFFKRISTTYFLSISSLLFICLGYTRHQIAHTKYQKNHIVHFFNSKPLNEVVFKIEKKLKPSDKFLKFKVNIYAIDKQKTTGNALLSLKKTAYKSSLHKGDYFVCYTKLFPLQEQHSPYSFDYATHLKNQQITHQFYLKTTDLKQIESLANPFEKLSNTLKKHLEINLQKQNLPPNVIQFTAALVLGSKSELDPQLNTDFANAGVIHILAISGLHMGILYLLIALVFRQFWINTLLKSLLIIACLWLFTWFSGASPSAIRATTMFSCFEFSRLLMRRQHPLNSLFVSVFILLLFDPYILFSVGFQLSVIAVTSIIIGVPKLLLLWSPKNWLIRKIWEITCISTCAQLGLLPLSIYYFHQFPGLFLLANIPIMLIITIVLLSAIVIIIWSGLSTTPFFITESYNYLITNIHNYIHWVAQQKHFLVTDLYIQPITMLTIYIIIAFLLYIYSKPKLFYQWGFLIILIGISVIFYEKFQSLFINELWLHHHYTNTIITEISSHQLTVHSKKALTKNDKKYIIYPIEKSLHLVTNYNKLQNSYTYHKHQIHIIDHKNSLPKSIQNTILIITNSPKINLERLLCKETPKLIIATNHNYKNLIQKWKATCAWHQVAFYDSSQKGSLNLATKLLNL